MNSRRAAHHSALRAGSTASREVQPWNISHFSLLLLLHDSWESREGWTAPQGAWLAWPSDRGGDSGPDSTATVFSGRSGPLLHTLGRQEGPKDAEYPPQCPHGLKTSPTGLLQKAQGGLTGWQSCLLGSACPLCCGSGPPGSAADTWAETAYSVSRRRSPEAWMRGCGAETPADLSVCHPVPRHTLTLDPRSRPAGLRRAAGRQAHCGRPGPSQFSRPRP